MQAKGSVLAQRAVVLQVLRDDHPERWTLAELERDIEPKAMRVALVWLVVEGVVLFDGETVTASPCARHLDTLGLIGV